MYAFAFLLLLGAQPKHRNNPAVAQPLRSAGLLTTMKRAVCALMTITTLIAGCSGSAGHTTTTNITTKAQSTNANSTRSVTVRCP